MKKIIVLLAALAVFTGTTLVAAESKPIGVYLTNGVVGTSGYTQDVAGIKVKTEGETNYALGLGAEYRFTNEVYGWLELNVRDSRNPGKLFDPFLMGTMVGADYEFINENLSGDFDWYIRAGGGVGFHDYTRENMFSFSLNGAGVAGVNWNVGSGQVFAQLRPTAGVNFYPLKDVKTFTRFQWSVALATGYRF